MSANKVGLKFSIDQILGVKLQERQNHEDCESGQADNLETPDEMHTDALQERTEAEPLANGNTCDPYFYLNCKPASLMRPSVASLWHDCAGGYAAVCTFPCCTNNMQQQFYLSMIPSLPVSMLPTQSSVLRRAVFTDEQRRQLEAFYSKQKYINKYERQQLAAQLRLKDSQVKVWFQNRRQKSKVKPRDPLKTAKDKPTSSKSSSSAD